ncbi:hypothetical protein JHV666_49570 [Mycobacterium avium subsp. hominissuis]
MRTSSKTSSVLVRMGRARSRTSVVPCGVDLDAFTPDGPVAALVQPLGQPERVEGLHGRYRMRAG